MSSSDKVLLICLVLGLVGYAVCKGLGLDTTIIDWIVFPKLIAV